MRRFLFLTAALVALAACGRDPTSPQKPGGPCVMRKRLSPLDTPPTDTVWYADAYFSVCPDSAQMAAKGWYRKP